MLFKVLFAYVGTFLLLGCSTKPEINSSSVILLASQNSGPGAAILTFRADGSCEWIAGMFSSIQEGHYQLRDSLIMLEGIELGGMLKSKRLLLTRRNPNNAASHDKILVQLDENYQVTNKFLIFNVSLDKRQSKENH